jgi:acetyltransferase-like isoleucine patch superfamily enzyme
MIKKFKEFIKIKLRKALEETNRISQNINIGTNIYMSGCSIDGDVSIENNCKIYKSNISGKIKIGQYTSVWGPNININGQVLIGCFCSIANNVSIQEYNHDPDRLSTYYVFKNLFNDETINENTTKGPIIIGSDVWIGMHSCILSGVKIGNGAIIAANSVVNTDIPDFAIVAGSPAKVLKYRFNDEIIQLLNEIKWWNWPIEKIKRNRLLFEDKLTIDKIQSIE